MPFPYESSKEPVRTRRTKDKDSRSTTSSSGTKKSKHTSGSSSRSTPHSDRGALASLYAHQNLTLDQLPALPESGTASPGSATSPILRATSVASQVPNPPTPILQHHTPAALQQYLDTEDVETPRSEFAPRTYSELAPNLSTSIELQGRRAGSTISLDSHAVTPQAATAQGYQPPSRDRSVSPSFFGQPLELHRSYSSRTSSSRRNETSSYSASSPPPQSVSPSVRSFTGPGSPVPSQHPYSPQSAYLASPPAFAATIPYHSVAPSEPYFPSPNVTPQPMQVTHPGGHVDQQIVPTQTFPPYANYPQPPYSQGYFNPLQHQSVQGTGSPNSHMSIPGEFLMPSQTQGTPTSDSPGLARSTKEDDAADLLQRIQGAIPDLQSLVHRYKETSGQLGDKESRLLETEAEKSEALRHRETEISQLRKELEAVKSKHEGERSRLRLEVGNMEEKHKELQDSLAEENKFKEDLQARHRALETELDRVKRISADEKAAMESDFAALKKKMSDEFAVKQKALEENAHYRNQDTEAALKAELAETKKLHAQEVETLRFSEERKMREREANHFSITQGLRKDLEESKRLRDESRKRHAEDRGVMDKKRELQEIESDKERAALDESFEERRRTLIEQYQSKADEMQKDHEASKARIRQEAEDETAVARREAARLKAGWERDKITFAGISRDLTARVKSMDEENSSLKKLAETFGEVTDLKSRGDPFYLDAFRNLEKQVSDLAVEHFQDPPDSVHLPDKIRRSIPPSIPSFFANTEAARNVRTAYVEHHISSIITRRIFQPFLFVLGGRVASVDQLFQDWSEAMKQKSTTREALWRQRTLHAAYSASSAKQSINKVASYIVDEVVDAIKYFTHHERWQHMTVAVRRVVKTAAETWRYARLELGLITASMSGEEIVRSPEPGPGITCNGERGARAQSAHILLTRFPHIKRDPVPGDSKTKPGTADEGYTFSRGRVLWSDDSNVLACQRGIARYNSMSRQSATTPVANRTQSRTQEHQTKGLAQSGSPTSHLDTPSVNKCAPPSPNDHSSDDRATPSPTKSYHTDRETPLPAQPPHDDRVTPSPADGSLQSRTTPSPTGEAVDEWHDAERESRTATPVQNDHSNVTTPDEEEPAASDRSVASSRQSVRSVATADSQHSGQSTKQAEGIPDWGHVGGEVPASESRRGEW